jgi:hypothetical protein
MRGLRTTLFVLTTGFVVAISMPVSAKGGRKPPSGCSLINVTSTINDTNGTDAFQIQSDGSGSYGSSSSLTDYIGGFNCQWDLDTTSSNPLREVKLDFEFPKVGSAIPPFSNSAQVPARLISRCGTDTNTDFDWTGMMGQQSNACALSIEFVGPDTNQYTLKMNPTSYSGTTSVEVQCTSPLGSNTCNAWSISPGKYGVSGSSSGLPSAIGELFKVLKGGKTQSVGFYYFDFSFGITNP